jgi:hypothetical protein
VNSIPAGWVWIILWVNVSPASSDTAMNRWPSFTSSPNSVTWVSPKKAYSVPLRSTVRLGWVSDSSRSPAMSIGSEKVLPPSSETARYGRRL